MHLSPDCVRAILLAIEARQHNVDWVLNDVTQQLPNYTADEVEYALLKLDEGGLINLLTTKTLGRRGPVIVRIHDITFTGHEFLDNIRDNKNWSKTKDIAKKAGALSLQALREISTAVIAAAIKSSL